MGPIHTVTLPMVVERSIRKPRSYAVLTQEIRRMSEKIDSARSYGRTEDIKVYREIMKSLKAMRNRAL